MKSSCRRNHELVYVPGITQCSDRKIKHTSPGDALCNGDKTLKFWKPLLTEFLLYEACRNVLHNASPGEVCFIFRFTIPKRMPGHIPAQSKDGSVRFHTSTESLKSDFILHDRRNWCPREDLASYQYHG